MDYGADGDDTHCKNVNIKLMKDVEGLVLFKWKCEHFFIPFIDENNKYKTSGYNFSISRLQLFIA